MLPSWRAYGHTMILLSVKTSKVPSQLAPRCVGARPTMMPSTTFLVAPLTTVPTAHETERERSERGLEERTEGLNVVER